MTTCGGEKQEKKKKKRMDGKKAEKRTNDIKNKKF